MPEPSLHTRKRKSKRAFSVCKRILLGDFYNYNARSELAWVSSTAENGILKIGKITDFRCHQTEHQLGVYTDCNHGCGLAVIHPVLYRHVYKANIPRFARFARNVWGVRTDDDKQAARDGIYALSAFIREIGLPTTFKQLGISDDTDFKAVANSTNISVGCSKKLTADEINQILIECKQRREIYE